MASNKYYLGDLITQRREKNPGGNLPIRGVSKEGLQPPKQIDADISIYNLYYRNDFVYNPARMELGSIAFNDEYDQAICSSLYEVFYVHRTDLVLPEYLALFVKHPEFARYCNYIGNGSAREYCRFDNISVIPIYLPSISEQRKIVHDYQVITDRIELLRKMNENLFSQMQTVFQNKYFDSEKYEDWELTSLDDITSKFTTGLNPRDNFVLGHGVNHYVTIKNMNNNRVYLDDKCDFVTDEAIARINQRSNLRAGDVLFSGIATIGRTFLIPEYDGKWNVSESIFTIRPVRKVSSEFLLALLMSKQLQDYAEQLARGSAQRGIRMADLKAFALKMPDDDTLHELTGVFKGFIDVINKNNKDEDCLLQLKDIVLNDLAKGA